MRHMAEKGKTGVKKRGFSGKMGAIGLEENTSIQPK